MISVHIPKTAGTSFMTVLEKEYGNTLHLLYGGEETLSLWRGEELSLKPNVKAIHGHFRASSRYLEQHPKAKLVTWIRHPVERIISYYSFWQTIERHGNPCHDHFLDNHLDIIEFAQQDYMKGDWIDMFGDVPFEQFDFIGTFERFEEDLGRLTTIMGWSSAAPSRFNANTSKATVSSEEREKLFDILKDDIALYEKLAGQNNR